MNIKQPQYYEYFYCILEIANEFKLQNKVLVYRKDEELHHLIQQKMQISSEAREQLMANGKGDTYFIDRISWAVTYLVHAQVLERTQKGVTQITQLGIEYFQLFSKYSLTSVNLNAFRLISNSFQKFLRGQFAYRILSLQEFEQHLQNPTFCEAIQNQSRKYIAEFKIKSTEPNDKSSIEENLEESTQLSPEEGLYNQYSEYLHTMKIDLLDRLQNLHHTHFEKIVLKILTALGYGQKGSTHTTQATRDDGIDGVIYQDILQLDKIAVQAKCYDKNKSIGPSDIQSFSGALGQQGFKKGIFITTARFSKKAQEVVEKTTDKDISLIDGDKLCQLMIEREIGIQYQKPMLHMFDINEDFFE